MGRTTTSKNAASLAASEARQAEVFRRYCQHQTLGTIGKALGISKRTVLRDVDRALAKCIEQTKEDVDRIKARALAQTELVKAEAWRGWHLSLKSDQTVSNTDGGSDKGCFHSTTTTRTRAKGNPRYLAQVAKCVEFECKLLGVMQSSEPQHNGPAVQFVEIVIENRQQKDELLSFPEFVKAREAREAQALLP